jgi:hypothetical protein
MFTFFFKLIFFVFCQVIHTIRYCVCKKSASFKELQFFETLFLLPSLYIPSHVHSFRKCFYLFAVICEIAKFAWSAALFDLAATLNLFCCCCRSHLRFYNLSSLSLSLRAPNLFLYKFRNEGANCVVLALIPLVANMTDCFITHYTGKIHVFLFLNTRPSSSNFPVLHFWQTSQKWHITHRD